MLRFCREGRRPAKGGGRGIERPLEGAGVGAATEVVRIGTEGRWRETLRHVWPCWP